MTTSVLCQYSALAVIKLLVVLQEKAEATNEEMEEKCSCLDSHADNHWRGLYATSGCKLRARRFSNRSWL